MIYLLDTTAISDWMNENPSLDSHMAGLLPTDQVVICPIVRGEVLFGIARMPSGKNRQRLETRSNLALKVFPCEPTPENAGDFYAKIRLDQELKGLSLSANDLWIAATTLSLGATLVSRDADYGRIDGFPVEDWSKV